MLKLKAETERDELYDRFVGAVQEVKQKCGLKNALLEHKIARLGEKLEVKEVTQTPADGKAEVICFD